MFFRLRENMCVSIEKISIKTDFCSSYDNFLFSYYIVNKGFMYYVLCGVIRLTSDFYLAMF